MFSAWLSFEVGSLIYQRHWQELGQGNAKVITNEEHIKQTQGSLASESCPTSHVLENFAKEFPKQLFFLDSKPYDLAYVTIGKDIINYMI